MGVLFSRTPVGRPAGVPDSINTLQRLRFNRPLEIDQLARAPSSLDLAIANNGYAGRVVATIFEPSQPVEEDGDNFLRSEIANDSAHVTLSRSG